MTTTKLVDDFFRQQYGVLVAALCRRAGMAHVELVEDSVQSALMAALETWPLRGVPDNPSAWLHRVANNRMLDALRQHARSERLLNAHALEALLIANSDARNLDQHNCDHGRVSVSAIHDDLLRMLFVCCDETIPVQSQIVFALKTLSGFDVREIASRLFMSEANVHKRLQRARDRLREIPLQADRPIGEDDKASLPAVLAVIYVLFTEGYLSSHAELAIRHELCAEAIRLATILAAHEVGANPETHALLALMHLHSARLNSRQNSANQLLLLEEQNRSCWDAHQIATGMQWLAKSAQGDTYSRYHAEAAIAAEHCLAPTFGETRWDRVAEAYAKLEQIAPSALHRLNRAVSVAEWLGARAGLQVLEDWDPPQWLAESHMWSAVLSDLNRRAGNETLATHHRLNALKNAPTDAVRQMLARRLRE